MPSYISHAVMAEQLYDEILRDEDILKTQILKESIRGYSLGNDLASLSRICGCASQNFNTKDFFITMIKYIKDNSLTQNGEVMALLYGHIAHYFLDTCTHPLIYYIEQGCDSIGLFTNHNLIEGYLSSYLVEKILNRSIMEVKQNYFNKIDLVSLEISRLLNTVYGNVYGDFEIIKSYRKILNAFSILESSIKSGIFSKKFLIDFSKFNDFLEKHNLTIDEIINNNGVFRNPITGETCDKSFIELYNQAIEMSINAIIKVNEYLYSNTSLSNLENVFLDLSYNTGAPCSLGKQMIYTRRTI